MDMDLVVIFAFILIAATMVLRFATAAHKRAVDHEERRLELKARRAEATTRWLRRSKNCAVWTRLSAVRP